MKTAAAVIFTSLLLTGFASNNTVAAPNDKASIVSPLALADTIQVIVSDKTTYIYNGSTPQTESTVLRICLQKPNKMMIDATKNTSENGLEKTYVISDGKNVTAYAGSVKKPPKSLTSPYHDILAHIVFIPSGKPLHVVFNKRRCLCFAPQLDTRDKIERCIIQLWLDATTLLPVREIQTRTDADKTHTVSQTDFFDWKLNAPLYPSVFTVVPPTSTKLKAAEPVTH